MYICIYVYVCIVYLYLYLLPIYLSSVRNSIEQLYISKNMFINGPCLSSLSSLFRISFGGRSFLNTACLAEFTQQSLLSLRCS